MTEGTGQPLSPPPGENGGGAAVLRILLLSDTHLGFDQPTRPRVQRRRRGPDFFACFERALQPALRGEADLVVHGGDLLYRSRVPARLVQTAMAPLFQVADQGVPVFLVPGNHERSAIPYPLLAQHRNLHLFDRPRTFAGRWGGMTVALSGFPFTRRVDGPAFRQRLEATDWKGVSAQVRLLCLHQAIEGARVGSHDFQFRPGADVIAGQDLPDRFAAVLSGHIHRWQVLERDLVGRPLPAPVLYPGATERTSFEERREEKGYLWVRVAPGEPGGRLESWEFVPLPARPMVDLRIDAADASEEELEARLRKGLAGLDPESVVRVRLRGAPAPGAERVLQAARLRALAPEEMNVTAPVDPASRQPEPE